MRTLHHILDYLSLFLNSYKGQPKFSLSWISELSHADSRYLYAADHVLYSFFLENQEKFGQRFCLLFGDHGPRLGKEARRKHGMIESRNPFLYIMVPKRLRNAALHKQLEVNSEELLTFHDLHATFIDILRFQPASNFTDTKYRKFTSPIRGSSLLRRFEAGKPRN
ncbi:hypothetical protein OESDEN_25561, partial [Oesophagostomum dentatum]